jgi:xanthine dehydrogenase accessory factor
MRELLPVLNEWLQSTPRLALATVISTWGSTPRPAGSHLIVNPEGRFAGSVSGGCVEGAVVEAGLDVIHSGVPRMLKYGVADELAWDVGLACGGEIRVWVEPLERDALLDALISHFAANEGVSLLTVVEGPSTGERALVPAHADPPAPPVADTGLGKLAAAVRGRTVTELRAMDGGRVFVQYYPPPRRLIVIGAVHITTPLVALAHTLGYIVTVVDPRPAFATRERFPDADSLLVAWPDDALTKLRPDMSTAVVVLTHDAKFDEPAISSALRSDAGYIGAIGSRTTAAEREQRLRALGFSAEDVARVHSPIGLDLGSVTPEEIALSILAQIVGTYRTGAAAQPAVPARAGGSR